MPGKRDSMGRWLPGTGGAAAASEDYVPELPMERYLNVKHVPITFGPASTTLIAVPFDTGLGDVELLGDTEDSVGVKWVLYGGILRPRNSVAAMAFAGLGAASIGIYSQLLKGTWDAADAIFDSDNPACLATAMGNFYGDGGAMTLPVPYDVLAPFPVIDRRLTLTIDAHASVAVLNDKEWLASLLFGVAGLNTGDVNAILQRALSI